MNLAAQLFVTRIFFLYFQVDHIDVSTIKPSNLSNAGLLIATLKSEGREIIDIKMVVQVSQDGGNFTRKIYNPLE